MWFRNIFRPDRQGKEKTRPYEGERSPSLLSPAAFRQLERLQLRGSRDLRGESMGQRSSHHRKPASDFREHRMYVPGDDIRFVDWRASARHEQIFIRQGELKKQVVVHILLDCSGSMLWGEKPKKQAQLSLAAALSFMGLAHGDRVKIFAYGGYQNPSLGPITGKGQMRLVVNYLNSLRYGGNKSLASAVKRLTSNSSGGGLVCILSDLLERGDLSKILDMLPIPIWYTNVLHLLHPIELNPPQMGAVEMVDIETGASNNYDVTAEAVKKYTQRIDEWQKTLEMACIENWASYTLIPTDWTLEREVLAHLRDVQVVTPI